MTSLKFEVLLHRSSPFTANLAHGRYGKLNLLFHCRYELFRDKPAHIRRISADEDPFTANSKKRDPTRTTDLTFDLQAVSVDWDSTEKRRDTTCQTCIRPSNCDIFPICGHSKKNSAQSVQKMRFSSVTVTLHNFPQKSVDFWCFLSDVAFS